MKKADVGLEVLRTPNEPLDRKAVVRATNECMKLINLVRKKNIANEYRNEYTKNLYRYNYKHYLAIFENKLEQSPRVYKQNDKQ